MTFILCPLIDFFFFCFFFGLLPQQIFCLHLTCLCHTNHLRRLSLHPCTFSVIVFLFASCLPAQSLPSFVQYFHYHFLCTCVYKELKKSPLLCFSLSKYNPFVCVCVWKLVCVSERQEGDAYGLTNKPNPVIRQKSDAYPSAFDQPRSLLLVWLQYLAPRGDTCR